MQTHFKFKPLENKDIDLICEWLNKHHVKEWWNDGLTNDEIRKKYLERIDDNIVVSFIVYLNDKPIGFIQYYEANKVGGNWWPDEIEGTFGIDQFIGDENHINKGLGSKMIRQFIQKLFEEERIKKIITDVDPKNARAIRCYEKVGFKFSKKNVMTPDGLVHVMEIKREDFVAE